MVCLMSIKSQLNRLLRGFNLLTTKTVKDCNLKRTVNSKYKLVFECYVADVFTFTRLSFSFLELKFLIWSVILQMFSLSLFRTFRFQNLNFCFGVLCCRCFVPRPISVSPVSVSLSLRSSTPTTVYLFLYFCHFFF